MNITSTLTLGGVQVLTLDLHLYQEEDSCVRWISVFTNVADQLYYPCEHIAWAADAELIKVKSDKWWLFSTVLWGSSLLLGILRWDRLYSDVNLYQETDHSKIHVINHYTVEHFLHLVT